MADPVADARAAALAGLLDEASAAPPARRDVGDALDAHRDRRAGPHGWTTGALVIGRGAVTELAVALHSRWAPADGPVPVAVLLADPGSAPAALAEVEAVQGVGAVSAQVPVRVAGRPAGEVVRAVDALAGVVAQGRAAEALLTLSGALPGSVPTATEVAGLLLACAQAGVGVRAVAARLAPGPQRVPGGTVHGVLGLLAAAALACQGAPLDVVRGALEVPGAALRLGPGALVVGELVVEVEHLAQARAELLRGMACGAPDALLTALASAGALPQATP